MIQHRPAGSGHPYLTDPDERVPLRPLVGERFEIRAVTPENTNTLHVELEIDGAPRLIAARRQGVATPEVDTRFGITSPRRGDGHLDETAAIGRLEGYCSWVADAPGLPGGTVCRYRIHDGETSTDWFDVAACTWRSHNGALELDAPTEPLARRLVEGSVAVLCDHERTYKLRFALRLQPGERVVGFGERFDSLDQSGRLVDTVVFDQYKGQGARSYTPTPFAIVVGGGFGFHVDTSRRVWFDVGKTDPERVLAEVDLEPGEPNPAITLRLIEGSPANILRAHLHRTGPPIAPPDWVYGLWMSGNEWNSQARVLAEVDRSAREGIEPAVVVIEAWSDEQTFVAFNGATYEPHTDGSPHRLSDFTFPTTGPWPDPKQMVDELHHQNIKVLLWQIPLVQSDEDQAGHDKRTMIERGYCVRLPDNTPYRNQGGWFHDALLIDFTNPDARQWWLAKRRYLIEEVGIDGFKTDGGEHAWGSDLRYADGTRGGETNNRYPVQYGQAYHDLLRSCERDPVTFSRAGFTGSAAIPCHWAGDEDSTWDAFRASLTAGLSASLSGIVYWGWDLAGFSGPLPTAELYLRSAAAACFAPIMQYHSEFNHHRSPSRDRTPWNVAEQTGDPDVLRVFRRFATLRKRLAPYLAEQGQKAAEERKPLMRALCFDFPHDQRIWEYPYQYLLGDALLVAPVYEENALVSETYIPAGDWVDAWQGETVRGPGVVARAVPIDEIPVYITSARADDLGPLFAGLADEPRGINAQASARGARP